MTCLMCPRSVTPNRVRIGCDVCAACEWLLRSDSLMRDAYRSRGGTFAGLTLVAWQGRWNHGTETGWARHGCTCGPCAEHKRATAVRRREEDRLRSQRRREAA